MQLYSSVIALTASSLFIVNGDKIRLWQTGSPAMDVELLGYATGSAFYYECLEEFNQAMKAVNRLQQLVDEAKEIRLLLVPQKDKTARGHLFLDGRNAANILIDERLAVVNRAAPKRSIRWCRLLEE